MTTKKQTPSHQSAQTQSLRHRAPRRGLVLLAWLTAFGGQLSDEALTDLVSDLRLRSTSELLAELASRGVRVA